MSHLVHLVIRTEGESSDREWEVEAVSSTLDMALDRACSLAAKLFKESNEDKIWGQFWPPYTIQIFIVDDNTAPSSMIVTLKDIRERHPELDPIIEARAQAAAKRAEILRVARASGVKVQERRYLDDLLRNRILTVDQYFTAVDALNKQHELERSSADLRSIGSG
jgi:hypothetical protein